MKNTGLILLIVLIIFGAIFLGGWLVTIGIVLFKIMIGLIGICLLVVGFYLGRWTK
jgi:hypothetical protein